MSALPKVIAFDIIETCFSLESMEHRLANHGVPKDVLHVWFAAALRDCFALAATSTFVPFASVIEAALQTELTRRQLPLPAVTVRHILDGFSELEPHIDTAITFADLERAGFRLVAVSNGSAAATESLLSRSGLRDVIDDVVSVDAVKQFKPRKEVYLHAAAVTGVEPAEMMLVAAHPWDIHGAKTAGLLAAFIARGQQFPATMHKPDIAVQSLTDLCVALR